MLILTAAFCIPVRAQEEDAEAEYSIPEERLLPRLVDDADLLTEDEESELGAMLDEISERQQFDVVVITVYSLNGMTAQNFADDLYDYAGYGMGEDSDGVLLLVSMENRDWHITTTGFGITAITDDGLDYISDHFLGDLSDGQYYDAFTTYAELCDKFVTQARTGKPYDGSHMPRGAFHAGYKILISLGMGFVIAYIIVRSMRRKLKSVRPQRAAGDYVVSGSLNIQRSEDTFLYSNVSKTARSSNSGSGSSTHTSSSGTRHGGRGGRF